MLLLQISLHCCDTVGAEFDLRLWASANYTFKLLVYVTVQFTLFYLMYLFAT
jgi:hypothetical protein